MPQQAFGKMRGYTSLSKLWKYSDTKESFGSDFIFISDVKRLVMKV